jgi:hypothetical protein
MPLCIIGKFSPVVQKAPHTRAQKMGGFVIKKSYLFVMIASDF